MNGNRICGWAKMIDRDGTVHYYGLNYRGQVLVDAVQERVSGQFVFTERRYNADGMLAQERRPQRGTTPNSEGSTNYTYDEIDPKGRNDWNDWLPVFWSRRANLLRVTEAPLGGLVWNDEFGSPMRSVLRYQDFSYEPLFNQLKSVEKGWVAVWPALPHVVQVRDTRIDYVFDYQELPLTETGLKPVLDHFRGWGFAWIQKKDGLGSLQGYDYQAIADWQLPLKFYGADLNGDGRLRYSASRAWTSNGPAVCLFTLCIEGEGVRTVSK